MAHPPVAGPPVGLVTDFGLADPYVGQMKAVLAGLAPGVPVIDISHGVRPGAVAQAGFFLAASAPHFPAGSVLAAVVDPGVGTGRRILGLCAGGLTYLAPDNGLLGLVLDRAVSGGPGGDTDPGRPPALHDLSAWAREPGIAATFHGRDVFAPLAARLVLGATLASLGPALDPADLAPPAWIRPRATQSGVTATVLSVDRFGNVVLNLDIAAWADRLGQVPGLAVTPGSLPGPGPVLARPVRTYADLAPGELGLVAGSQGFLELSLNQEAASGLLGCKPGEALALTFLDSGAGTPASRSHGPEPSGESRPTPAGER